LAALEFPLPPLREQRRIAAKLDTTLAAVDACRQRLDGVAAILKRFRQAVLAGATSGELTREWREERGVDVAPIIPLGEIIKVSSGKFLPAKAMVASGGIPVYGGNGVNGFHNESNVHEPTLVIGRVGYYCGSIHLTPGNAWVTDNALTVRHDGTSTRKKYLYFALQGINLRANDSSTAQPVISGSKIYSLGLMCPCIEEQDEIIDRVESLFTLADQLEAKLTTARKIVDRLTPAMLAKAFRGELVPQDPNDEPASVLLERIRAARQAEAGAGKTSRRGRRKAAANPDQIPLDAAPVPPNLLTRLLQECGALSERALLAASELEAGRFRRQLELEMKAGRIREELEEGERVLVGGG
jgi:type I restriction enzyme S subunit